MRAEECSFMTASGTVRVRRPPVRGCGDRASVRAHFRGFRRVAHILWRGPIIVHVAAQESQTETRLLTCGWSIAHSVTIKKPPICPYLTLRNLLRPQRRPNPRHIQPYAVQTALGTQIQGFPVIVSPSHVMRMLGTNDRAQMFALR